jgi:hypothetical protein
LIKEIRNKGLLNKQRYSNLRNKLLLKQAKEISSKKSFEIAIKNCFEINPFYWTNPKIVYVFLKKFIKIKRHQKGNSTKI